MTVKMSLGIKQLSQDPWTDITSKYPVGSKQVSLETLQTLVFS
jgi:small subunit ribosomal protein S1